MVATFNHGNLETEQVSKQNGQHNGPTGNYNWVKGDERLSNSKTSLHSNGSLDKLHLNGFVSTESITENIVKIILAFSERSGEAQVEIKTITVTILSTDKRFGFSVVGGFDQGFPARIEEITADSPSSRTDLQINDEILEVNGIPVGEANHADIIIQIHKCIQKKVISLRIRRYLDGSIDDEMEDGEPYALSNDGFHKEICVDGDDDERNQKAVNRKVHKDNNNDKLVPESFINPAFDKDDISDEDLDSSMARPSPERPRTLPIPTFIALVESLKNKMVKFDEQDDVKILRSIFNNDEFQSAIKAHNNMARIHARKKTKDSFQPVVTNSTFLLAEVRHLLMDRLGADELLEIINKPTMQNFLLAHDLVAKRDSLNNLNDDSSDDGFDDSDLGSVLHDEETVTIARIDKTNEPLGATVKNEGDAVIISRIVKGGVAEKSGLLHEGDEILEINSNPVKGKTVGEVVDLLRELEGTLTFLIVPAGRNRMSPLREKKTYYRAQFDYDPYDDTYLPCRELGLAFRNGDILEILENQEDPNWWQAKKIDEESVGLAKLIPSKTFQQQREATKVTLREEKEPETTKQKKRCFCIRRKKKTPKKTDATKPEFAVDEILTYEEMVQIYPDPAKKRPIVLIGPPKVGRREMRNRLISTENDRFAPAIPHTSRPPKLGEMNGKDYFFISQDDFQRDIADHKFVEYGQYEGFYYGTSIEAIQKVINNGKVCVLNLHCQALPVLKNSDLRPYVVFITLPSFDQLRKLRQSSGEPFNPNVTVKDDDLVDLIERAREMDIEYGHYFDNQVVNQNLDKAYEELLRLANFIETQPQWIPAAWVH
eukprot:gene20603-22636_t